MTRRGLVPSLFVLEVAACCESGLAHWHEAAEMTHGRCPRYPVPALSRSRALAQRLVLSMQEPLSCPRLPV
jgi:hypothetical protein